MRYTWIEWDIGVGGRDPETSGDGLFVTEVPHLERRPSGGFDDACMGLQLQWNY
jgi:hypothetical protein